MPRPLARQPWKVTSILWPLIVAAILPLRLTATIDKLTEIATLIDSYDAAAIERRVRQVEDFRDSVTRAARLGRRKFG